MTENEKVLEYLAKQRVIALSTSDENGVLHSAVVYVYGKTTKNWYVVSKQDTKKVRNLKANPRFSSVAYDRHDNSTLQARGLVRIEGDPDVVGETMAAMAKIYGTEKDYLPPIAKISAGEYVVLRLEVEWLRFTAYGGATPGSEKIFIEL